MNNKKDEILDLERERAEIYDELNEVGEAYIEAIKALLLKARATKIYADPAAYADYNKAQEKLFKIGDAFTETRQEHNRVIYRLQDLNEKNNKTK